MGDVGQQLAQQSKELKILDVWPWHHLKGLTALDRCSTPSRRIGSVWPAFSVEEKIDPQSFGWTKDILEKL